MSIAEEFAALDEKCERRPFLRRIWLILRPIGFLVLLIVQPIAALLILGMTMSLASIFTGRPPALAFWVVAGILAALNALATYGAWRQVVDRLRVRVVDPHAILIAVCLTGAFVVAGLWIWYTMRAP